MQVTQGTTESDREGASYQAPLKGTVRDHRNILASTHTGMNTLNSIIGKTGAKQRQEWHLHPIVKKSKRDGTLTVTRPGPMCANKHPVMKKGPQGKLSPPAKQLTYGQQVTGHKYMHTCPDATPVCQHHPLLRQPSGWYCLWCVRNSPSFDGRMLQFFDYLCTIKWPTLGGRFQP